MLRIADSFKKSLHITIPLVLAVVIYMFINRFDIISNYVNVLSKALKPFVIGFFIAFLLKAPLNIIENKLYRKLNVSNGIKRTLAVLTVYGLVIIIIVLIVMLILPQIVYSVKSFATNAPQSIDKFTVFLKEQENTHPEFYKWLESIQIDYETIITWLKDTASNILPHILQFTTSLTTGLYNLIMGIIASIYMLATKERFSRQSKKIIYSILDIDVAEKIVGIFTFMNKTFTRYLIGVIIDSSILGCICALFMTIFRMPYVPLISFIIGCTNIIPVFGPFIGAIPGIIIIATVNPITAFWFAVLMLCLQQIDGNILYPRVLGDSIGISPFWVLFSVVTFGSVFGFSGMLLGVPTFTVIYRLTKEFVNNRLKRKNVDLTTIYKS